MKPAKKRGRPAGRTHPPRGFASRHFTVADDVALDRGHYAYQREFARWRLHRAGSHVQYRWEIVRMEGGADDVQEWCAGSTDQHVVEGRMFVMRGRAAMRVALKVIGSHPEKEKL